MAKKDLLKKSVLIGIGLGAITKSKVEKYIKELKKEGYLDVAEGKKLARDMISETKRMEKALKSHVKKRVQMVRKIKAKYKSKKASVKRRVKSVKRRTKKKPSKRRSTKKTSKKRTTKKKISRKRR